MTRWLVTIVLLAVSSAAVRADVTIVQTTTVEGGMAAMANAPSPEMTTRVKGLRSRTDLNAGAMSVITIADLVAKQIIVLRPDQKTATVSSLATRYTHGDAAHSGRNSEIAASSASISSRKPERSLGPPRFCRATIRSISPLTSSTLSGDRLKDSIRLLRTGTR